MIRMRVGGAASLAGIVAATVILIALTWLGTFTVTRNERAEDQARIEASVAKQAALFGRQVEFDLLEVDETLHLLARAWETDPDHFHLVSWRSNLLLLNAISPDIFIADEGGTIRDATIPEAVGTEVRDRDYFRGLAERLFDDGRMFISPSTMGSLVRPWHINVARPLYHRDGSFAGVIVAALRINAIGSFYRMANIGTHGMIAVVGLNDGRLRLALGVNPIDPGTSIAASDMFKALQADPNSVWVGRTALDGVERMHGFHRASDRGLAVVVAVDRAEAMHATESWIFRAYLFASGITALLLLIAAIVAHDLRAAHRRAAELSHERAVRASADTELELARSRVADKTTQLDATLAAMTDGVAMVNGNMQLVQWNSQLPEIAGIPRGALRVGLPIEDILRAQAEAGLFGNVDVEADVTRRVAALRAGDFAATVEIRRPDGREVELRRKRLPDGGLVMLYKDITAHRESLNALREANATAEAATTAGSRFISMESHEIHTPLNTLLSSLSLLADSGLGATQQSLLDMARQSGDALLAQIDDILDISHMEAGQLALRPGLFALRPLIEEALGMFAAQAAEQQIALGVSIAPGVPDQLCEDPARLRQVLINLLSNAMKSAGGEVRVLAEMSQAGNQRRIRLAVRDRGPVIPEATRMRLFDPASDVEDSSNAAPTGAGLGLTICRHLVAWMGGEIGCSVWTVGGRDGGNEFWLNLPIKAPLIGGRPVASRVDLQPRRGLPRTRILLVEDIRANQLITATPLRREGHLVDVACNGPEAIRAAAICPYDLILMDIAMPGMSGLETAQRLRGLGGPATAVPIIALTANPRPEDQVDCAATGMNGMLAKPVALRDLLEAIMLHVWQHRAGQLPIAPAEMSVEPAAPQVLSFDRLDEMRAGTPADTLIDLVEKCLFDLSERHILLLEAVRQQAPDQITAQADAMAVMAGTYGMAALETRLRALAQAIRQTPDAGSALMQDLEAELLRATTALREAIRIEMV